MASWVLVPCLVQLRNEFNKIAPGRDKASDGSIGDTAHQHSSSDHNPDETGTVPVRDADKSNEVHAIDVDRDLRESDLTMEKVVQFILGRCRSGAENRLRYIIYNRRIWSASSGWVQKAYTGSNPHDKHAHFSASYTSGREASTASWHLEDIPVALTSDDRKTIENLIKANSVNNGEVEKVVSAALTAALGTFVDDFLAVKIGDKGNPHRTVGDVLRDTAKLRGVLVGDVADTKNAALAATSPLASMIAAAGVVLAGEQKEDQG